MSLLIALSLAATATPIAPVPRPATYGDWTVSCDNGRDCRAVASSEDWDKEYWSVDVRRAANAAELPTVSIWPRFEDMNGPGRVVIDGQEPGFAFDARGTITSDPVALLRALAKGQEAQVLDASGQVAARLPTKGASAALRWLDDQQKRTDTVTALVATGPGPVNAVPAPPSLPSITVPPASNAPPKTLDAGAIEAVREVGECTSTHGESAFFRLDARLSLGLIPCGLGAYQGWSMAVMIDESGEWSPAVLEQPRDWSAEFDGAVPWLMWSVTSADYTPKDRLLSGYAKGRGLGDCGSATGWVWDGAVFRLSSYRSMEECRGTISGDWPVLWRTTNSEGAASS